MDSKGLYPQQVGLHSTYSHTQEEGINQSEAQKDVPMIAVMFNTPTSAPLSADNRPTPPLPATQTPPQVFTVCAVTDSKVLAELCELRELDCQLK